MFRECQIWKERWDAVLKYLQNSQNVQTQAELFECIKQVVTKDPSINDSDKTLLQIYELSSTEKLIIRLFENGSYYLRCEINGQPTLDVSFEIFTKSNS